MSKVFDYCSRSCNTLFKFTLVELGVLSSAVVGNIYIHGHNTLRLFDILPNFPLITRETKRGY